MANRGSAAMMPAALVAAHLLTAVAALAAVAVNLLLAAVPALRGGQPPPHYRSLHRATAALVGIATLLGLALYATGQRPHTELHLVYAAGALLAMPVARAMVRRDPARARLYQLGGTALLLGVIIRLLGTG